MPKSTLVPRVLLDDLGITVYLEDDQQVRQDGTRFIVLYWLKGFVNSLSNVHFKTVAELETLADRFPPDEAREAIRAYFRGFLCRVNVVSPQRLIDLDDVQQIVRELEEGLSAR